MSKYTGDGHPDSGMDRDSALDDIDRRLERIEAVLFLPDEGAPKGMLQVRCRHCLRKIHNVFAAPGYFEKATALCGLCQAQAKEGSGRLMDRVTVSLKRCARCGRDHTNLTFTPFTRPAGTWTHWVLCPETAEPIMLRVDEPASPPHPYRILDD